MALPIKRILEIAAWIEDGQRRKLSFPVTQEIHSLVKKTGTPEDFERALNHQWFLWGNKKHMTKAYRALFEYDQLMSRPL